MTRYYEPWSPKLGDRVRVHIRLECEADHAGQPSHTGTVTEVTPTEEIDLSDDEILQTVGEGDDPDEYLRSVRAYDGHRIWVSYDEPFFLTTTGRPLKHDLCAVVELERLRS